MAAMDGQTCRAPKCDLFATHPPACKEHFYKLPLYLRNEIRKDAGKARLMDGHIRVAQAYWRAG